MTENQSTGNAVNGEERVQRVSPLLYCAAFVSGGAVMVVELLGSRVLGPFFGVGLFVWSALLAVTLGALALGYYLGGLWADRKQNAGAAFWLLIGAGCAVALVPMAASTVLAACEPFGLRLGSSLSALALLGPGLTLLGMVTTTLTREVAASTSSHRGRELGKLYALSTVGGLLGTLLTGFLLIPSWSIRSIFVGTAVCLIAFGLLGRFVQKRSLGTVPALLVPLLALATPSTSAGEHIRVLERAQSVYGTLSVIQDDSRGAPLRLLRADHSFIGGQWSSGSEPAFSFVHILEAVHLARRQGTRALSIGLGIGSASTALSRFGVRTDVVEIDAEVVRLAREYFNYSPTGSVYTEDGRTLLQRLNEKYDFIIHDTFTGGAVADHLLSVEILATIRERLVPAGVLALNIVGAERGSLSRSAHAVNRTLRHVFPHVRAFRDGPPQTTEEASMANIIFFASTEPVVFARPTHFESETCEEMLRSFQNWEVLRDADPAAPIIHDSNNALAVLSIPVTEAYREAMNELYPTTFWLAIQ